MHEKLLSSVPEPRLKPYTEYCKGGGDVGELYRWNSRLSLALFDDISVVEVAMRSAMARELRDQFGDEWFTRRDLFDDETAGMISEAWTQGRLANLQAKPDAVHGKLVASFMLGFWVRLLGRGSVSGAPPLQVKRVYDDLLWKPALRRAFPHVGDFERAKVATSAGDLKLIRNRIAHHEHVIWGVPAFGQRVDGRERRIGVKEAASVCTTLAGYMDAELELWISKYSQVLKIISECPVNPDGLSLD